MSSIAAGTTTGTALVHTADTTGDLVVKTGGSATTAITVAGASQQTTFAAPILLTQTVASGIAVASTHKVTITINGTTYYLLASNV